MAHILATGSAFSPCPDTPRGADRCARVALAAARGIDLPGGDVGLVCGIDYGIYPTVAACLHRMSTEGYRHTSPQEFILATPNIPTSVLAIQLGIRGPTTHVCCGDLSGLVAIGVASRLVETGRASALLAGGASSSLDPLGSLAAAYGAPPPREAAAFVLLGDGAGPAVAGFVQRRLRNGSMSALIADALEGGPVETAFAHPREMDGLPAVPLRDFPADTLEASGALAVVEAAGLVRDGAAAVLVAMRSLDGKEGAALVVRSAS